MLYNVNNNFYINSEQMDLPQFDLIGEAFAVLQELLVVQLVEVSQLTKDLDLIL